jgi:hypothetical protein
MAFLKRLARNRRFLSKLDPGIREIQTLHTGSRCNCFHRFDLASRSLACQFLPE